MRSERSAERFERGEHSLGIGDGGSEEEGHIIRSADVAVENHCPTANHQELGLRDAELNQQVGKVVWKFGQASHRQRKISPGHAERGTVENPPRMAWHSLGMPASFTSSPSTAGAAPPTPSAPSAASADKLWDRLRFDLAKAANGDNATINFHLDDVVVCDAAGVPIKRSATLPITLLDHLLTIINPDPKASFETDLKRLGLVIPVLVRSKICFVLDKRRTSSVP